MSVIEKPLPGFDNKLVYKNFKYPICKCKGPCFNLYFNAGFVGSRNSGKSYSTCLLIKHFEKYGFINDDRLNVPIRTFLISPTAYSDSNECFKSLISLDFDKDVYTDYSDELLKEIREDIKRIKDESEERAEYIKAYKKYDKLDEEELYKLSNEDLVLLTSKDFTPPNQLPKLDYEVPPVNFIICDDLLGASCFNGKRQSYFQKSLISNRHYDACFLILLQSVKAIPKNIRINLNLLYITKFSNSKIIIDDLYIEVANVMKLEELMILYQYVLTKDYGALCLDLTGKNKRILLNFDKELEIQK